MKLIFKYISMHFKSQLEYKSSFILSFISQIIPILLSSYMVFILIDKFNFGDKFDIYEVMLGMSIVQFGFSFSECFGRGFDTFSNIIKHGSLDLMLIRPRNIYIQIFGSNIEFSKLSRVIGSIVLFVIAINNISFNKSIFNIVLLILLMLFSSLIYLSLYIIAACFCFKTIEGLEFMNIFTDGSREFGQYPMGLFKKEVLIFFTYLIPIACVNYYPVSYVLGKSNSFLYLISPLFCFVIFIISIILFNRCMKNYTSSGS